jgi:integrase
MAKTAAWTEDRPGGVLPRWRGADGRKHTETLVSWSTAKRADTVRASALKRAERAAAESVLVGPRLHVGRKTTVGALGDQYHDEMVELDVWRPKTASLYRGVWNNHVRPRWGDVVVGDIGHRDVQTWVAGLRASGKSGSLVQKCAQSLSRVLDYAVREGLVAVNACRGVALPPLDGATRRAIPTEHLRAIVDNIDDPGEALFVVVMAETGLRVGEAAGLLVGHVDLDVGAVHVEGQLTEDDEGHLRRSATKTKAGNRWVPINSAVVEALRPHVEGHDPDDPLFTTASGAAIRVPNFRARTWGRAVTKAGFDYKVHELRHTRMTRWAEAGVSVDKLVLWGGYSRAAHVLDVYVHPQRKAGSEAVDGLPSFLDPVASTRRLRAV